MYVVMDKMEAQLRFGNAIMLAGADMKPKQQQKKKETAKKDGKNPAEEANQEKTNSKKDSMDYIIATMRGQENEAGDDYPLVDVDVSFYLVLTYSYPC